MHECFPKHSRMGIARIKQDEEGKRRGVSMEISKAGTKKRSPDGVSLPNQNTIIIIYHDFLSPPRRGSQVKSDNTQTIINIHPLAHMLDICAMIFSSCAIFTIYPNIIKWRHPTPLQVTTTKAREGGSKEHRAKQKWPRETHSVTYVPGLSTVSDFSRIFAQPPPSFLCCSRPPSHLPSSLTSVSFVPALHLLPPSTPFGPYGTHPFFPHAQNISILSDLLYSLTPFLFRMSTDLFSPNSTNSLHYNQTSQTLHLKNIHFPSLGTSHAPCLSTLASSYTVDTSRPLSPVLYCFTFRWSPHSIPPFLPKLLLYNEP